MRDDYSHELARARLAGTQVSPPSHRLSLADGYALQARAAAWLGTPAGWKVGATSVAAMRFLGVAEPIRGRLYHERMFADGGVIDLGDDLMAEPEILLVLGRDLGPGEDPLPAVARAAFAAEIVRPTRADAFEQGPGFIVADNAAGLGVLVGPVLPLAALGDPAAIHALLAVVGGDRSQGSADAVLGDPLRALAWLARATGGLPAGSAVMTGAMARAVAVPRGATLTLDCGAFGRASARFH